MASIWLVQRVDKRSVWGFVIGLIGQPFWIYATYKTQQWGMLGVSIWWGYWQFQGIVKRFDLKTYLSKHHGK